jgi:hypothetical protein
MLSLLREVVYSGEDYLLALFFNSNYHSDMVHSLLSMFFFLVCTSTQKFMAS